jgi:2-polyprenyl-3-methyl-5-hydroxy-6-metoxy-1,4-benzoquinol methylase
LKCKICHNEFNIKTHLVKEMMYGTRKEYSYLECSTCGCLQLLNPPDVISEYYPNEYYSFEKFKDYEIKSAKNIIKNLRRIFFNVRGKIYLNSNTVLKFFSGRFIDFFLPSRQPLASLKLPYFFTLLDEIEVSFQKRILDVGSGAGYGLVLMNQYGFTNLTGIDPFIEQDIFYNKNVKILKKRFEDISERYDIVIFQHSFEHMKEPLKIFEHLNNVTHKDSYVIIATPLADSYAWEKYKSDWVQIDAPRHFFIHTKKSLKLLADTTGFSINKIKYDSSEFQFWGSEQYKAGIPLLDKKSYKKKHEKTMFSKSQLKNYKKQARELNKNKLCDQAIFFLNKNI